MVASPLRSTVAPLAPGGGAHALETLSRHFVGRKAEQAAQLTLVRREHCRQGALGQKLRPVAERVQPVGVEKQRPVEAEQLAHQKLRFIGAAQARPQATAFSPAACSNRALRAAAVN